MNEFGPVQAPADTKTTGSAPNRAETPALPGNDRVIPLARAQTPDSLRTPVQRSAPPATAPMTVSYRTTTPATHPVPATNPAPATTPAPPAAQISTLNTPAPAASASASASDLRDAIPNEFVVKTTAYTHTEPDSLQYGTKSATGDDLKYGRVRSAAADWSRYPVGTRFKIKGLPYEYVVDDYGRALVGTDTIDLYKPNYGAMNQWGARDVGIEVLEWGSFEDSKRILEGRKHKPEADHVRKMLNNIEQKIRLLPPVLRDGFRA